MANSSAERSTPILIEAVRALAAFRAGARFQVSALEQEEIEEVRRQEAEWMEHPPKANFCDAIIDDALNLRAGWIKPSGAVQIKVAPSVLKKGEWSATPKGVEPGALIAMLKHAGAGRDGAPTTPDEYELKLLKSVFGDLVDDDDRTIASPKPPSGPPSPMPATRSAPKPEELGDSDPAQHERSTRSAARRSYCGDAGQREILDRHVINLRAGRLSSGGIDTTTRADLVALVEHISQWSQAPENKHVVLYAHGGLVSEESALKYAWDCVDWWRENNIYPVFFVWETGGLETINQIIEAALPQRRSRAFVDATDWLVERICRIGRPVWGAMKAHAQLSAGANPVGGARAFAQELAKASDTLGDISFHAVGHSAGSIFHTHFLPALEAECGWDEESSLIKSIQFLAPAVNLDDYMASLHPIAARRSIDFACFTMRRRYELDDHSLMIYRKSLLYLVSRAFEEQRDAPIFGLEESLRGDTAHARSIMQLFNDPGNSYDLILGPTGALPGDEAWRSATQAVQHGDFDNDRPTMTSVAGRILGEQAKDFPHLSSRSFFGTDTTLVDLINEARGETGAASQAGVGAADALGTGQGTQTSVGSQPITKARVTGDKKMLSIAINDFPGRLRLNGCIQDSKDWMACFDGLGFSSAFLHDEAATGARVREEIAKLVAEASAGDAIALHISSHGTQVDDLDGDEPTTSPADEAVVCHDYEAEGGLLLDDHIYDIIVKLRPGVMMTTIFDLCHSGTATRMFNLTANPQRTRDAKSRSMRMPHSLTRGVSRSVRSGDTQDRTKPLRNLALSACLPHQEAIEFGGKGLFSRHAVPIFQHLGPAGSVKRFERELLEAFGDDLKHQKPLIEGPEGWEAGSLFQSGS